MRRLTSITAATTITNGATLGAAVIVGLSYGIGSPTFRPGYIRAVDASTSTVLVEDTANGAYYSYRFIEVRAINKAESGWQDLTKP
jgi:hypothetical protein